jgi:hypothetical protein
LKWFSSWLPIYQDKYKLMGNTQIMVVKIFWDWAIYWSVPCLLFANKGFTNFTLIKDVFMKTNGSGEKFQELNKRMQDLFTEWQPYDTGIFSNRYIDPFDLSYMRRFQEGIEVKYETPELITKIDENIRTLELIAAEIFRFVSHHAKGTSMDMKVDPYSINLNGAIDSTSEKALERNPEIANDVSVMWFYPAQDQVMA